MRVINSGVGVAELAAAAAAAAPPLGAAAADSFWDDAAGATGAGALASSPIGFDESISVSPENRAAIRVRAPIFIRFDPLRAYAWLA